MERLISFGFVFVGITLLLVAVPGAYDTLDIARHASEFESTPAVVTGKYTKKHRKGPATVVLKFRYMVDGHKFMGDNHHTSLTDRESEINDLIHHHGSEDDTIKVYYDPEHPSVCVIRRHIGYAWPLAVFFATAMFLYVGVAGLRRDRHLRQRRHEREADD